MFSNFGVIGWDDDRKAGRVWERGATDNFICFCYVALCDAAGMDVDWMCFLLAESADSSFAKPSDTERVSAQYDQDPPHTYPQTHHRCHPQVPPEHHPASDLFSSQDA